MQTYLRVFSSLDVCHRSIVQFYRAEFFSKRDAEDLLKKVGEFIKMARQHC